MTTTSKPIEDYAIIGGTKTAALVAKDGSIDWLCLPRFDSAACFAALLGDDSNGRWKVAPQGEVKSVKRRYRGESMVLETEFTTDDGVVRLLDFMMPRTEHPTIVRVIEGVTGRVPMATELVLRFDYGKTVPWVRSEGNQVSAVAGPNALAISTPVPLRGEDFKSVGEFTIGPNDIAAFVMAWHPSHLPAPELPDARVALEHAQAWWEDWSAINTYRGEWESAVAGSLRVLKALTYAPTGGILAAATTSLPEEIGGVRNWDYRYCWLRDATFTLQALLHAGYTSEAMAWRDWLLRAIAGRAEEMQIMYGPAGERQMPELELDWLAGYAGSKPVRVGNAAADQFQLDVYGEVIDAINLTRMSGVARDGNAAPAGRVLLKYLLGAWRKPDDGLWEVRGGRQHFTHSKVMAWVAMDRAIKLIEDSKSDDNVEVLRRARQEIHDEVCEKAFDTSRGTFTQYYGSKELDASTLLIPLVGFLPPSDPRVIGTVESVQRELSHDGLLRRYSGGSDIDGLPGTEGAFLACSFWLVDALAMMGRNADGRKVYEHLLSLRNDVGLLSEEYDVAGGRQLGNFPQAFSHVGVVNSAIALSPKAATDMPARHEG